MTQNTLFGDEIETESDLFKRFLVPPFSVLDTRQGYWQERKRKWINLGIKSEIGRNAKAFHIHDWIEDHRGSDSLSGCVHGGGVSVFDPILTELIYLWFTKEGQIVLDPFCDGSVRGVIASRLKRRYIGIDLREEQIRANKEQLNICGDPYPTFICNDSRHIPLLVFEPIDFLFSCPPYGNLETYSELKEDISTMEYPDFIISYAEIIEKSCQKLKNNRFACFVVGNFRDKKTGTYNNFVADTISCFNNCGLKFYNEFILLNSVGSMCLRINKQFRSSRKNGNIHQTVLVFIKGDAKKATEELGEVKLINPFKQDNRNI